LDSLAESIQTKLICVETIRKSDQVNSHEKLLFPWHAREHNF